MNGNEVDFARAIETVKDWSPFLLFFMSVVGAYLIGRQSGKGIQSMADQFAKVAADKPRLNEIELGLINSTHNDIVRAILQTLSGAGRGAAPFIPAGPIKDAVQYGSDVARDISDGEDEITGEKFPTPEKLSMQQITTPFGMTLRPNSNVDTQELDRERIERARREQNQKLTS